MYIYIYIYIHRERERERERFVVVDPGAVRDPLRAPREAQRGERLGDVPVIIIIIISALCISLNNDNHHNVRLM